MIFKILITLIIMVLGAWADSTPQKLPPISLKNLNGEIIDSKDWTGKVVILDFWATWCLACRDAYPVLNELNKKYESQIQVAGITNETASTEKISRYVKKMKIDYLILRDPEDTLSKVFGFESVPTLYVFGKNSELLGVFIGLDEKNKAELQELVAKNIGN